MALMDNLISLVRRKKVRVWSRPPHQQKMLLERRGMAITHGPLYRDEGQRGTSLVESRPVQGLKSFNS
jgi:hypothetical protein